MHGSAPWKTEETNCTRVLVAGNLEDLQEGTDAMTKVAVYHESADPESMPFRAVSGRNQAMGRTAGEALDALAAQLPQEDADTLVIVRNMSPDRFFSAGQRRRLEELMALRREAIATNSLLTAQQEAELEQLVDAEVRAATDRATALFGDMAQ